MISSVELSVVLIVALFLFGPKKLPELARSLGGAVGEFKKAQRAAELDLTTFDSYTRKNGSGAVASAREEEKGKETEELKTKPTAGQSFKNSLEARSSIPEDENPEAIEAGEKIPGN
ncbi:Sec-independent protein translocase subunit TatA/TatB [Methanosarcina sp. T3]|uniref:Sec-independent protein translocase subunit TatA/TatB n=1 Tax=Methanosarcina sp. T3 TaxID=3439062 RepID=UPI003F82BBA1